MAARDLSVPLPEGDQPWWELMDASLEDMMQICDEILSLYHRPKVRYSRVRTACTLFLQAVVKVNANVFMIYS